MLEKFENYQEFLFPFAYCCIELTFALTHFYVFIGFKNPALSHIRKEKYYFLGDALCHLLSLYLFYKTKSIFNLAFWLFLFLIHLFYFIHLCKYDFPGLEENLYPIFKWSCIGYKKDRFNFKESGSEMVQTTADIMGHLYGAIFIMEGIEFNLCLLAIMLVLFGSLVFFKFYKYFVTDAAMMPKFLGLSKNTGENKLD